MATVGELIERTRLHLYGSHTLEYNQLHTTVNSSITSLVMEFPVNYFIPGGLIALEDEICMVIPDGINNASRTLTVIRGFAGTTAAAHDAGVLVEANPRFPNGKIRDALITEIRSWGHRLWAVDAVSLAVSGSSRVVDMTGVPEDFFYILDALRRPTEGGGWPRVPGHIERNLPTSDVASGTAYILDNYPDTAYTLRVIYAFPFDLDTFDDDTDLQDDVLLPVTFEDIAALGAAWQLLLPREIKRTFTESQGEPRDSQEVPPGHITQTATALRKVADSRIAHEIRVLQSKYRWRMT